MPFVANVIINKCCLQFSSRSIASVFFSVVGKANRYESHNNENNSNAAGGREPTAEGKWVEKIS